MLGQICYCINAWSYSFSSWKLMFSDITLFSATPKSFKLILWKAFSDYPANVFMVKEQSSNVLTKQEVTIQNWSATPLLCSRYDVYTHEVLLFFFVLHKECLPINMVLKVYKQCCWYDSMVTHITVPIGWKYEHGAHEMFKTRHTMCDFRLPPWSRWELHSSGLLHREQW